MKRTIFAIIAVTFGVVALCYIVVANPHSLFRVGLSVPNQLVAQRIIAFVVYASLVALPFGVAYFERRLPQSLGKSRLVRFLVIVALVVVPIVLVIASFNSPIWSFPSPSTWERPQFYYGWPLPIKRDGGRTFPLGIVFINWIFWTLYLQCVLGSRRLKHYIITLSIVLGLSFLGVLWCGGSAFRGSNRCISPKEATSEVSPYGVHNFNQISMAHGCE